MADRADLVVVGAGTVGGWASVFAAADGAGRVVVLERGLAGVGASSRAAGIVRAQGGTPATVALGRWSIDFYRGQPATYGTDSGFRELGYLILAVTDEDERAGRERVEMQHAAGLTTFAGYRLRRPWTSPAHWPRRSSRRQLSRRDGHIDPPRNVRAYSLAMQRPASSFASGPRSPGSRPERRRRPRVVGVDTTAGPIETDTGPPHRRARRCARSARLAGLRIPAGAARHTVAVLEPHEAFAVERDADGVRHRCRAVLAARGGRAAVRLERPGREPGEAREIDWAAYERYARPAGRLRAAHPRPRPAPDLGGDDRLHARPPADPRPGHPTGRVARSTA